jgi:leucyl-tRNA synthetase
MGLSAYPFNEIEEKQRQAGVKLPVPSESPDPATKQYVLPLSGAPGGLDSFSELRRLVVADVHARLQRLLGVQVLFPPSRNSFPAAVGGRARPAGSPAEEAARQESESFRALLHTLSISLDDAAEVDTGEPRFYRWAQWLFLELEKRGLVSRKSPPSEERGERAAEGPRDRGQRLRSGRWFADLSSFGDRLLNDLDRTNWPAPEKKDQR